MADMWKQFLHSKNVHVSTIHLLILRLSFSRQQVNLRPVHWLILPTNPSFCFKFDRLFPALPTLRVFAWTSQFGENLLQGLHINGIIIRPCSAFREVPLGRSGIQLDIVKSTHHPSQGLLDVFHQFFGTLLDPVVVNSIFKFSGFRISTLGTGIMLRRVSRHPSAIPPPSRQRQVYCNPITPGVRDRTPHLECSA